MKPIYRTVLRVVVFSRGPIAVEDCGLEDLSRALDCGDFIGGVDRTSQEAITDPNVLRAELLIIGNDGEFFDYPEVK